MAARVQVVPGFEDDAAALQATVARALAAFKVPTDIWIDTDPMPHNAAGKVIKSQLRAKAISEVRRS